MVPYVILVHQNWDDVTDESFYTRAQAVQRYQDLVNANQKACILVSGNFIIEKGCDTTQPDEICLFSSPNQGRQGWHGGSGLRG